MANDKWTIKFVYAIFPVLVRYVAEIKDHAGFSYGPYIKIKDSYKNDIGLLNHELTHSRQFYRTIGLWWILYRFAGFRYGYEVEAYRVQLSYVADDMREQAIERFVGFIANKYSLSVDTSQIYKDLKE